MGGRVLTPFHVNRGDRNEMLGNESRKVVSKFIDGLCACAGRCQIERVDLFDLIVRQDVTWYNAA